ncbi:MAG TPA: 4-alpha-glucanotransferase [Pirellulales bacterium]|nr:4-alpha-glucanotransferase [Pirellulales bacterium]
MSNNGYPSSFSPFPPEYRASGVLLHVTSLPSPFGIGDVGPAARAWIDRLHEAGQTWWQALPLGPTGYGNSPYQPLSSFAGNWLLISPEGLIADGLLRASEVADYPFSAVAVDYDAVLAFKLRLLEMASANFGARAGRDLKLAFEKFSIDQAHWLDDYALFRALKARHSGASYLEWPTELVRRDPDALAKARRELTIHMDLARLAQFLLFRQGDDLKQYAHSKGVHLIGDLPFYVSPDSSDVWANSKLFLLDEQHRPRFVGGVPPDYFSSLGQLWGNPVYDWAELHRTGYRWYIDRVRALLAHVDLIRLDHFRGFAAAWHTPAGAATARSGQWVPGPGAALFEAIQQDLGALPFVAEDLGIITPDVRTLRDQFHLPGTRVLQFAFDGHPDNPYLPQNYNPNTVVYTGTHDNNTTRGWYEELPDDQRRNLWNYLKRPWGESNEVAAELLHLAFSSKAALALAPLQDLLNLGADARMNVPGRADGNWRWRSTEGMLAETPFHRLRDLTSATGRSPTGQPTPPCLLVTGVTP